MVKSLKEKICSMKARSFPITLETVGFLLFAAATLRQLVYQNVYLMKACRVNFQFNASQCDFQNPQNSSYDEEVNQVQSFVSTFLIFTALLENLPGVFFLLILGPLSNKYGRKPLMICSICGFTMTTIIMMANLYFDSWPVEYTLFGSLVFGLCGGAGSFYMASSSYMADVSSEEERTFRMSVYNGISFVSMPIASFSGIYLLKYGGEWAVWFTALALHIICLFYLTFFVVDSRGKSSVSFAESSCPSSAENDVEPENCVSIMNNLRLCISTTFKKRPGNDRACILALLVINCLTMYPYALANITYLYTRVKFDWNAADYAQYVTISSFFPGLGGLILVPILSGYFKLKDGILGMVSLIGATVTMTMVGFASVPIIMYLSTVTSALDSAIDVVIRSVLSKVVKGDELGHVFSFLTCVATIMPLLMSPTVKLVYRSTLGVFPGTVFVVGMGLTVIAMILLMYISFSQLNKETGSCFTYSKRSKRADCSN